MPRFEATERRHRRRPFYGHRQGDRKRHELRQALFVILTALATLATREYPELKEIIINILTFLLG